MLTQTTTTEAFGTTATQYTWQPEYPAKDMNAYEFIVTLVHRTTGEEKILEFGHWTDSFCDVMDKIAELRPDANWGVFEILDTPF
jgi:hypothetical protein